MCGLCFSLARDLFTIIHVLSIRTINPLQAVIYMYIYLLYYMRLIVLVHRFTARHNYFCTPYGGGRNGS